MRTFAEKPHATRETSSARFTTPGRVNSILPAPRFAHDFSRVRVHTDAGLKLQPKLVIGAVSDPLEHEADHIADQVMRMPDPAASAVSASDVAVRRKCAECEEEEEKLARKETSAGLSYDGVAAPEVVHQALASPGQPLDDHTRDFFQTRFGHDFSRVRVHLDDAAAASARAVGALAYTVGRDIVFAERNYAPGSTEGRRLLAHELTHVLQQSGPSHHPGAGNNRTPVHAAPPMVARVPAPGHCGGVWTCAATPCTQPDTPGNGTASTSWSLDLNIDTDVETAADIAGAADVGHTYVVFKESSGAQYSYGFYPQPSSGPEPIMHPEVFGCVVHTDTVHKPCVDYTEHYSLSQKQYTDALTFAQNSCVAPPHYNLSTYNCTTWAVDVAKLAGQSPPSPRGSVAHGGYTADNPNTLKEGYLDQHVPTWRLKGDTEIRDWVASHDALPTPGKTDVTISVLPTDEKVRLLNRLLDGFVSDDDVAAFEKICSSITNATERTTVQTRLSPRLDDLTSASQSARVYRALFGRAATAPAPAATPNQPPPPPPK